MTKTCLLVGLAIATPLSLPAQVDEIPIGGVFPRMTVVAPRAESRGAGIGALIPWADKLWAIGYVAHEGGEGLGLYCVDELMRFRRVSDSVTGTFANRMVHWESEQAFIGPYAIRANGEVRILNRMKDHRLAATMRHLTRPKDKVYFLTMEGLLFEVDVQSLAATQLFELTKELKLADGQAHFTSAHTAQGRVVVANNTYGEEEFRGSRSFGLLAEWDGQSWSVVERNPFVEVAGKQNPEADVRFDNTLFATGWNRSSVILRVLHEGEWKRYLLPKASHSFDHTSNSEWMRIREAQTGRYLMDVHGMFYDLPALIYDGQLWGVRPIASHLRVVTDFCYYRGLFAMAADQTDNAVGQPQSGLWFGNIDDLWQMGKPAGWGGPWWDTTVKAGEVSDPFLMTGFDKKVLHVTAADASRDVEFAIEIDFRGDGSWQRYHRLVAPAGGYAHHVFPDGFSAHWVRLRVDGACLASAYFMYN